MRLIAGGPIFQRATNLDRRRFDRNIISLPVSSRCRYCGMLSESKANPAALISAVTAMPGIRRKLSGTSRSSLDVTSTRAL